MACVFGEMRALKTSERAAAVSPKSVPFRKVSRNSSSKAKCVVSAGDHCW